MSIQFQRTAPTTGQTVTFDDTNNGVMLINPAGTLLALTLALPATPRHLSTFRILCTQIITTLTLTLPTSATLVGATLVTSAVNFNAEWLYDKVNNQLIRLR